MKIKEKENKKEIRKIGKTQNKKQKVKNKKIKIKNVNQFREAKIGWNATQKGPKVYHKGHFFVPNLRHISTNFSLLKFPIFNNSVEMGTHFSALMPISGPLTCFSLLYGQKFPKERP